MVLFPSFLKLSSRDILHCCRLWKTKRKHGSVVRKRWTTYIDQFSFLLILLPLPAKVDGCNPGSCPVRLGYLRRPSCLVFILFYLGLYPFSARFTNASPSASLSCVVLTVPSCKKFNNESPSRLHVARETCVGIEESAPNEFAHRCGNGPNCLGDVDFPEHNQMIPLESTKLNPCISKLFLVFFVMV